MPVALFGAASASAITSPAPGSVLGSSATFSWSQATGANEYMLFLGTEGVGSSNLFDSGGTTATSVSVSGIPEDGVTVYVRLNWYMDGAWQHTDYTYTESGTSAPASLTSPAPGSVLGSSATFAWNPGAGPAEYMLFLGTEGVGSANLYNSGGITATSVTVTGIPEDGVTINARLHWYLDGAWQYVDYTYTESGTSKPASLTSPAPGSTLTGSSATFAWNPGAGPAEFMLFLGTEGAGSANLYDSGSTTATSVSVSGLPENGAALYVRLYWYMNGAWQYANYTYTEGSSGATLSINATSLTFGDVALNTPATQSLTLTSTGGAAVTVSAATVTGSGFSISGATFPLTLNLNQSATLEIEFDPTTAGAASGQLTIISDSLTNPTAVISLSGTGVSYQVDLSWDAPSSSPEPVAGYDIYRATNGSSSYQLLNSAIIAQTSYTDSTVQPGESYGYYVESVDAEGNVSAPSNTYTVNIP